jgi:hypothetical protein
MKNNAPLIRLFALVLSGLLILAVSAISVGEDKIVVKTENGVTVVYNPENPAPPPGSPTSLLLRHDLTIGEDAADENSTFSELRSIQVDDQENIYALDMKEIKIKVFDKNGKFIRAFGTKGQGPGEIGMPIRMEMIPAGNLVIYDLGNNKFIFFSPDGKCLQETLTGKYWALSRFKFDSAGCIYADTRTYEETKMSAELKKFSPDFKPLLTVASFTEERNPRLITPFSNSFAMQRRQNDTLIWMKTTKYEFTVVDGAGKPVKKIIRDWPPVKITAAIKERMTKEDLGDQGLPPGYKYEVPSHFPPVYYFTIDDQDRLYVCTYAYEEKEDDYWPYFDVFDAEGRYIAKFFHPRRELIFAVKKDKLYCMVQESEEGIPLVKRYSMVWK